jgi:hypothetical protein
MQFIFSTHPAPRSYACIYGQGTQKACILLANYILSHFISIHYHLCVDHAYIPCLLYIVRLHWHGEKGWEYGT